MALSFGLGDLAWNAADAATTTYTISSLSFQPKAILFVINGQSSSVNSTSSTISARWCYGFATTTSDRRCVGFYDVDATASADTQEIYRDDAVLATVSAAGAVDGRLDLNSLTATGFTLIVDDATPVDLRVFWYAWGGTDIVAAATGEITEPAATGNQSYSVTGWNSAAFTNAGVLFAGCQLTAAPPTAAVQDAGIMLGAATGTGAGNQWVMCSNSDEGSANMDTDRYIRGDECLAMITVAGGNPNARATFNGFDSAGFDLNWVERGVTNRRYIYLAMEGGSWRAGNYVVDTTSAGNTTIVSGLPFAPVGAIHAGFEGPESASDTSSASAQQAVGGWSSLSSRRAMGYYNQDGTADSNVGLTIRYDCIFVSALSNPRIDIDAINSDGFRVIVDNTGASATSFETYLAFGNSPPVLPREHIVILDAVRRSHSW